ncbi:MAG: (2Fe-2S) ferredoxin domain-containing protein [Sphaerochaeta sp.]|jgi:NADP-reducing hydrogenase subunit HndB|nr:(2Fe-2S) ferredoxin domain-containing protein [Sphaerochaeta sp.]MCH3919041.1 (2Fe-2S) ferredoxin domain-containing protein [Sphaerochaeta sp.]MCI2044883.1 (2Fe-2S) ferredoxin domain-containing protein [Sphaerochaeta sp.]MCI2075810.1 (2Fe-2S) ferredoxin domain-containing protein [Sphaerochaeta sp.]MCI2096417.1 (2Fe-2S) ferredoxin domain-containing protein [Sphaerochaeta sp.]
MTLEELRKLREDKQKAMEKRDTSGKDVQVIVGMGTCGIAAGAKVVLDTFLTELDKKNISNVSVTQTGCMGLCYVEPTVEVIVPGMPDVIYGKVDRAMVDKIIDEHIIGKQLISDHIYDRPAADIMKK